MEDELKELMQQIEQVADPMAAMILRMADRVLQMMTGEIGDRISLNIARMSRRMLDDLLAQGFERDEALALMTEYKSPMSKMYQQNKQK